MPHNRSEKRVAAGKKSFFSGKTLVKSAIWSIFKA